MQQMSYQPDLEIDISQTLDELERRCLDAVTPPSAPIWGKMENLAFVRVLGIARFWQGQDAVSFDQCIEDLIVGVCGQALPLRFLLLGGHRGVRVYLGLEGPGAERTLRTSLNAALPGIQLQEHATTQLGSTLDAQDYFAYLGRLTGIPSHKSGPPISRSAQGSANSAPRELGSLWSHSSAGLPTYQIDRLLRGLYGQEWGYFVSATPIDPAQVIQQAQHVFTQLSAVSGHVDWQHSRQAQTLQTIGPNKQRSESESLNRTVTNYCAKRCLELLGRQSQRLEAGRAQGMWETSVHFFATRPATLGQIRALLGAVFSGLDSTPDPIRTFACQQQAHSQPSDFTTILHSSEMATMIQLPRQESPGYRVTDYARFDTDPLAAARSERGINVGKILEGNQPTRNWFIVPQQDFAKHALVVGVTGSGKTNTLFYLLDKLWDGGRGVPFLVIEPAKAEYRDLRIMPRLQELRVYTLGDETIAPLRLNPFEFEVSTVGRMHIQTHIDYLKSIFNAAFILYAPMPYVLETCLHEVYEDKGWDLTNGLNHRLPRQEHGNEAQWPVFPTLGDLYYKIGEVVERLGYEERIKMDVRAALQTRVASLMLGGKGLMLDTAHSVPMAELLSRPTVLELERIGNDDEKAFLIGLILTRLYEYRRLQSQSETSGNRLQHVAVFEEAHRLLKNVATQVETETANIRGQAVETFANMLSEIRAYGQGVLIAEQIPAKLAPDAIKNTNIKLMHRIVAVDDREIMGGTMNLDDSQSRVVASLPVGQAAAYAEGADRPYRLQMVNFKDRLEGQRMQDAQVAQAMGEVVQEALYDPVPGYGEHINRIDGRYDPIVRDRAMKIVHHPDFPRAWARYFLSAVLEPTQAVHGYVVLLQLQRGVTGGIGPEDEQQTMLAMLLHAAAAHFEDRGRAYGWLHNVTQHLRAQFITVVTEVARGFDNDQEALTRLIGVVRPLLEAFTKLYVQQVTRRAGFFAGCVFCSRRCLYRHEVALTVADITLERDFVAIIRQTQNDQDMWRRLARMCTDVVPQVVTVDTATVARQVALCYAVQMGAQLGFSSTNQRKLVKNIRELLAREKKG
jgi:hypothetical protein